MCNIAKIDPCSQTVTSFDSKKKKEVENMKLVRCVHSCIYIAFINMYRTDFSVEVDNL